MSVAPVELIASQALSPRLSAGSQSLLRRLRERTGLPLLGVETDGEILDADGGLLSFVPPPLRPALGDLRAPAVFPLASGMTCYAVPVAPSGGRRFVAFGYQLDDRDALPADLVTAAAESGWTRSRLAAWAAEHPRCSPGPLSALLDLAASEQEGERAAAAGRAQLDQLSEQLEQTYEEISLLHTLSRNLQISRKPGDLAVLCLERMTSLIDAEGHAVCLHAPGEEPAFLTHGVPPFRPDEVGPLLAAFEPHDWGQPLVRNHLDAAPAGRRWDGLRNLVVAPIREGRHRYGWIVSANLPHGREFGTVEASLLNTLGTILGTHVRNIDLYREHEDLLLSFVRSMVSALDAKDAYTRGHSERVALVARRIGRQMGLPDGEVQTIHLSGLLHDVGKVGIDDRILRKNGPLTDEEFEQVKRHPMIGYQILSGLKNLRHVLPGVRNHHENYDGSGYPDGLKGDEISLLARILAVADGYDAMGSDRPYRKGMPAEKIDGIFRRGAGTQWDPAVVDAFFGCRDDITRICEAYSPEAGVDGAAAGPAA